MFKNVQIHASWLFVVVPALGAGGGDPMQSDASRAFERDSVGRRTAEIRGPVRHADTPPSREALQGIVTQLMSDQYGNAFDVKHACWPYTFESEGDTLSYCMRPRPAEVVVDADGTTRIYVAASSVADINDDPRYAYSHVDAGLFGAFMMERKADGGFALHASSKDVDVGSAGDCACADAAFVRVGVRSYGWSFSGGGVWQGVSATKHFLFVADHASFKDISRIPRNLENEQAVEYRFDIDSSDIARAMYPLLVTRRASGGPDRAVRIEFDTAEGAYVLPDGF